MGYLKDTIRGFSWMVTLRGTTRVLTVVRTIILARLLDPTQFGIFGIAAVSLAFLEIATETGINAVLIQEKTDIKKFLNTTWVISIVRGTFISLALLITAKSISGFFKSPESVGVLMLISLVAFLRGFINPAIVRFQKELEFNKEFYLRSVIFFANTLVAISLAFLLRTAHSLIFGMLTAAVLEVIISFAFIKPRPKFSFNLDYAKSIVKRGKWITATGIFNYIFQQGDDIVVGRLISTKALGMYQVAYKISTLPITEAGQVLHRVTFPVFVKISHDKKRLLRAFIKVVFVTSFLLIPFGLIIFFFAGKIVEFTLGNKWLEIVPFM